MTIPKPGKPDYGAAKAYRVISLLNCLGKMVEKVAAYLISNQCERQGALHPGQYGCRPQRSSVDAVGLATARTQEAWSRGRITGALLMDVAAAFPSVVRGCLLQKMRNARIGEDLVRWTDSFMRDRMVIMSVDGQDRPPMQVTTGLPQGSSVSPVLFNLYIGEIHGAVEQRVPGSQALSFVDDVTWFVEGTSVEEVASRLEWCAEESLRWAERNAVRFEISKTEAILQEKGTWQTEERQRGPGRGQILPLRPAGYQVARGLGGFGPNPSGELEKVHRQGPSKGGHPQETVHQAWTPPGFGSQPAAGHSQWHDALRLGARLGRLQEDGEGHPAGPQSHGQWVFTAEQIQLITDTYAVSHISPTRLLITEFLWRSSTLSLFALLKHPPCVFSAQIVQYAQ